jgi:hypothetical protein
MPTILSDPPWALYLLLFAVALVFAAVAARNQDRKSLLRFALASLPLLLLFLCDRRFESPREEATRKVQAMAAAATDPPSPDRFVENISASFNEKGKTRDAIRNHHVWDLVRQFHARVAVWGFGRDAFEQVSEGEIEIGFYVKADSPQATGFVMRYARARFVKDSDGQYRVKSIKFYDPAQGMDREAPIEGFP